MLKIGLTGGIGCGKSSAVDAFRVLGVPIVDADQISKDQVRSGQPALSEIAQIFGNEVLLENGELNRTVLKEKIFKDTDALARLESILHPKIRAEIERQIKVCEAQTPSPSYIIVDIPLLIEKNYQSMFDRIVVVDCLPEQQIERVKQRDTLDESAIQKIMDVQAKRDQRLKIATDILDNTGDIEKLQQQIKKIHDKFKVK